MIKRTSRPTRAPNTTSRQELLIGGSDDRFRELLDDLLDFAAALQRIRGALATRMDLTAPQYAILMAVAHAPVGVSVGEVAMRLRVTTPFIVQETGRLQKAGLIEKVTDEADRRRALLHLTESSKALLVKFSPLQVAVNDVLFSTLSRSSFRELGRITKGLLSSSDNASRTASFGG